MRLQRISSRSAKASQPKAVQAVGVRAGGRAQHVQTKLRVGASNDAAEREADRTARIVLARLQSPASTEAVGESGDQVAPTRVTGGVGRVRRAATATATIGAGGGMVDASLEREINSARRSGTPLAPGLQESMGRGFGADFADVRVHTGAQADELNRSLQSRAFTLGNDIFFARDQYEPGTTGGQELLAHELTHTLQQNPQATASRMIQRWVLTPNVNLTDAVSVTTIKSGQAVFFLEDATGDKLVVKGDNVPVGMNQLFAEIHQQVSGTQSISMELLPNAEKATMKNMIRAAGNNATWDTLYATKQNTVDNVVAHPTPANLVYFGGAAPATPRGKAQLFHMEQLDFQPKLVAMTNAGAGGATDVENVMGPAVAAGSKNARQLFRDPVHMQQLGMVTATDLFLGNTDRVVSGNFGNWFVNPAGAITLIDSIDATAKGSMSQGDVATQALTLLGKGAIAQTARDAIQTLIDGMVHKGDATAPDWAANVTKGKTIRAIMEAAFLKGLKDGKARIVKNYATDKGKTRGRAAKQTANATQGADANAGDNTQRDYWETIKARARWLKSH